MKNDRKHIVECPLVNFHINLILTKQRKQRESKQDSPRFWTHTFWAKHKNVMWIILNGNIYKIWKWLFYLYLKQKLKIYLEMVKLQVFLYILPIHKSSQSWWRVCLPWYNFRNMATCWIRILSFPFHSRETIKVWVRVEIWRVCKEWDLLFLLQTFKNIICTITDKNFLQMYQLFVSNESFENSMPAS